MNKRSDQKRKMLRAVIAVLELNRANWEATPGVTALLAELKTHLDGIDTAQQSQNQPIKTWTAERRAQRRVLIALLQSVAAFLRYHARRQQLSELLNAVQLDNRNIVHGRQTATLSEAERIAAVAAPYAALFVPAKPEAPNRLAQLEAAAADFRLALDKKRQREVNRSTGTRSIQFNAVQSGEVISQLDDLLSPYRDENPAFFAAYEQARRLIEDGVRTSDAAPDAGKAVTQPKAA